MSTTFRAERAAKAIQQSVAKTLLENIKDPRLASVTITRCEITSDLSYVRIYYAIHGGEAEREEAELAFDSATPFLRTQVGQDVPLRTVPELSFRYDEGIENTMRIDELLSNLPELKGEDEEKSQ